jgi:hypothetical protein
MSEPGSRSPRQDLIADIIELESSMSSGHLTMETAQTNHTVAKVCKLIALCERMSADGALARQLRRKFV